MAKSTVAKFWCFVFLLVPIFGVGVFLYGASPLVRIWLPSDASENGHNIDSLFMLILWLTGIVFIATETTIFWFLWKYNAEANPNRAKFTHGSHTLEVVWTIIPAVTLLFIALFQMNAWAEAKMRVPHVPPPGQPDPNVFEVEVQARQFEWRIRYPNDQGLFGVPGELFTVNDMHVPVNKMVLVHLKSQDVLHSFFLPNMRVKQDAVPGMTIPVWFEPIEVGVYDIVCSQLCGWGHYKMKGRLTVDTEADFRAWRADLAKHQNATLPPPTAKAAEGKSE